MSHRQLVATVCSRWPGRCGTQRCAMGVLPPREDAVTDPYLIQDSGARTAPDGPRRKSADGAVSLPMGGQVDHNIAWYEEGAEGNIHLNMEAARAYTVKVSRTSCSKARDAAALVRVRSLFRWSEARSGALLAPELFHLPRTSTLPAAQIALLMVALSVPLAFAGVIAVFVVKKIEGEVTFLVEQDLFIWNLVIGCVCLVVMLLSLVWWLYKLWRASQTGKHWCV